MNKSKRILIYNKYNNHCGYCGKHIEYNEMQIDHIHPQWSIGLAHSKGININSDKNLMPSCRRCNHYKREKDLEGFREYMATLCERVSTPYINKVAIDYGIITINKFNGVFYFEEHIQEREDGKANHIL